MRSIMVILTAAALVALVNSLPLVENANSRSPTLDQLTIVDDNDETPYRTKRTIGILRQLFPDISKMIEKKVNMIVGEVIRALGPTVIRSLLGGARGNTDARNSDNDDGSTVTLAVPIDDDDDDDSDSNDDNIKNSSDNIKSENNSEAPSLPLPTVSPGNDNESNVATTTTTISTISIQFSPSDGTTSEENLIFNVVQRSMDDRTMAFVIENPIKKETDLHLFHMLAVDGIILNVNQGRYLAPQEMNVQASENNEVRVSFEDIQPAANEAVESELQPLEDIEVNDEESRNKRLVSLGGNSGGDGGSGGGSGNFLFDIIRLVAGSGSQSTDGQPSTGKSPEIEETVPGPATRLLVIANRGISNLIQDLILRIAATTERFVNFKARLITSII